MIELALPIETFLKTTSTSALTETFLWIMLITFSFSLFLKIINKWYKFTNYTPTLLTSLGILGTFAGIISGLLVFDPKNIESSIEGLLSGLQVAFITSLVGMAFAILYKTLTSISFEFKKSDTSNIYEIGIEDLFKVMKEQNNNLFNLQKSISDNTDSSLIGQIKLMRSDMSDNYKAVNKNLEAITQPLMNIHTTINKQQQSFEEFKNVLWIKLQDFADMLSKSATEQVIQALKEVITDFNNKLSDQFGENFKQLNSAIGNLLQWQDNYKIQLGEMRTQFDQSVLAITETEKSVNSISNEAKTIPKNMNELKAVMEVNQHQISELSRHLEAFKDVRDKAVESVPEIKKQIEQTLKGANEASDILSKGMTESIGKVQTSIITSIEEFDANVHQTNKALNTQSDILSKSSIEISDKLTDTLSDLDKHVRVMLNDLIENSKNVNEEFKKSGESFIGEFDIVGTEFKKQLTTMANDMNENIGSVMDTQSKQLQRMFNGLDDAIQKTLENTGQSVKDQVDLIDEVMSKEIENVMTEMGGALARISNQFTNDYQRLVSEMQNIVSTR